MAKQSTMSHDDAPSAPAPAPAEEASAPASAMTSDDPAVLHVAAATLAQKIESLGLPTGAISDTMVNAAAKAMLDAVDMFEAGGGGTQKAQS